MKRVLDTILALSKSKKKQLYKYFDNLNEFVDKVSEDLYDETNGLAKIAITTKDKTYTSEEKNTVRKDLGLPYSEEIVLAEWDGNTEGLETVTQGGLTFYKLPFNSSLSPEGLKIITKYSEITDFRVDPEYYVMGFALCSTGGWNPYYKTELVWSFMGTSVPISSGGYMPPSGSYTFAQGLWVTSDFRKLVRTVYGNVLAPEYIGTLDNNNIPVLDEDKLTKAHGSKSYIYEAGNSPFRPNNSDLFGTTISESDLITALKGGGLKDISLDDIYNGVYDKLWNLTILNCNRVNLGNSIYGIDFTVCDVDIANSLLYIYAFKSSVDGSNNKVYTCSCKSVALTAVL